MPNSFLESNPCPASRFHFPVFSFLTPTSCSASCCPLPFSFLAPCSASLASASFQLSGAHIRFLILPVHSIELCVLELGFHIAWIVGSSGICRLACSRHPPGFPPVFSPPLPLESSLHVRGETHPSQLLGNSSNKLLTPASV